MTSEKYIAGFCETLDWRPVEFTDLPSAQFCSLCHVVPGKTFTLQCGHAFCDVCFEGLRKDGRQCPVDKQRFDESCVRRWTFTRRQVETQIVWCVNHKTGCNFVGTVEEMKRHFLDECTFHSVPCGTCNARVLRREIVNHCTQGRCQYDGSPPGRDVSNFDVVEYEKKTYDSVRRYGEKIDKQLHEYAEEMKRNAQLVHDIIEKQEQLRADVRHVLSQQQGHHEDQVKTCGEILKRGMLLEKSMQDTNETVSFVLERISNFSTDVSSVIESVTKKEEVVSEHLESLSESLACLRVQQLDCDEVFCHIRGFSKFLKKAEETVADCYSDVFLFCGYSVKLCVQICDFNGISCIGLYLHICKSPRDFSLKWPFSTPFTLMLAHPANKGNNIEYSLTNFDIQPDCFCRPTTAANLGWGAHNLCRLEDIDALGFVFQDSICVGVKICSG